jgi:hypothetical protein
LSPTQTLALVYTFGASQPGVQAITLTLLCMAFLVTHVAVRPSRSPVAQALQTLLLFCLAAVAVCGTPFADELEKAVQTAASSPSDAVVPVVQSVFGVGLPLAGLAVAVGGPHALALARAGRQLWRACRRRLGRASLHGLQVQEGEWQRSLGAGVQPQAAASGGGWEGPGGRVLQVAPGMPPSEAGVEDPPCWRSADLEAAAGVGVRVGTQSCRSSSKGGELDAVVDWDSHASSPS